MSTFLTDSECLEIVKKIKAHCEATNCENCQFQNYDYSCLFNPNIDNYPANWHLVDNTVARFRVMA